MAEKARAGDQLAGLRLTDEMRAHVLARCASFGGDQEELEAVAWEAVAMAVRHYDSDRGDFLWYARRCITNALFDAAASSTRVTVVSPSEIDPQSCTWNPDAIAARVSDIALALLPVMSVCEFRALQGVMRGETAGETARRLGVSRQSVASSIASLREKAAKLGA